MFEHFKERWNINSNFQFTGIMVVFAAILNSALYVKKGAFQLLAITEETELWLRTILYIVIIFPAYNIMLLLVGFMFGQFKFAWQFEKKNAEQG